MNTEKLHTLLADLGDELNQLQVPQLLGAVQNTLQQSIDAPSQENSENFRGAVTTLFAALEKCPSNDLVPSQYEMFRAIRGTSNTGKGLRTRIENVLNEYNITPASAVTEITKINQEAIQFAKAVQNVLSGFSELQIALDVLGEDEYEVGLIIPRAEDTDTLDTLGEDIQEFDKFFKIIGELVGNGSSSLRIRTIGTTDIGLFLETTPVAALAIITIIERFLAMYMKILEIRIARKKLEELEMPKEAIAIIQQQEDVIIKRELHSTRDEILDTHAAATIDKERRNELSNGLDFSLKFVAKRIDQGLKIEISTPNPLAGQPSEEGESPQIALDTNISIEELARRGKAMQSFGRPDVSPALLRTEENGQSDEEAQ